VKRLVFLTALLLVGCPPPPGHAKPCACSELPAPPPAPVQAGGPVPLFEYISVSSRARRIRTPQGWLVEAYGDRDEPALTYVPDPEGVWLKPQVESGQ
jgi:hypothetical protein